MDKEQLSASEAREGDREGRPSPSNTTHRNLKTLLTLIDQYCFYYGLRLPTFTTLLDLVITWDEHHKGMTIHELCLVVATKHAGAGSYYTKVRDRVELLRSKGYVEVLCRNSKGALVYCPTNKVLSELGYIDKMVG
jgi:hypothetical protein